MDWARLSEIGAETILFDRADICCAITRIGGPAHALFATEREALGRVAAVRAADFAAGRHCARAGLGHFGAAPVALPIGQGGAPRWPPGFVGSITHGAGFAGAAVTRLDRHASLGFDIERRGGVIPDLHCLLFTEAERAGPIDPDLATLLFSAKETIYKAAFPLLRRWIDFQDVSVLIDFGRAVFHFRSARTDSDLALLEAGEGSFSVQDDIVLTLFRLPPHHSGATAPRDHPMNARSSLDRTRSIGPLSAQSLSRHSF